MMRSIGLAMLGAVVLVSTVDAADVTVNVGIHPIQPASGQIVDLYVSGGAAISGVDLAIQTGDGASGPKITAVDLESGIFLNNNSGQQEADPSFSEWARFPSITTESGLVIADGWLVRLTIDASEMPQGSYDLVLSGIEVPGFGVLDSVFLGDSGQPLSVDFTAGTLVVVPEPATIALLAGGLLLLARHRRA